MTRFIKYNFFFLLTTSFFFLGLTGPAFLWIAKNGPPYPGFPPLPVFNALVLQSQGLIYAFSAACFLLPLFFGLFFLGKRQKDETPFALKLFFWMLRFGIAVSVTAASLSFFIFPAGVMLFAWLTFMLGDLSRASPDLNAYPKEQFGNILLWGSLGWISVPFLILAGLWFISWVFGLLFKPGSQQTYHQPIYPTRSEPRADSPSSQSADPEHTRGVGHAWMEQQQERRERAEQVREAQEQHDRWERDDQERTADRDDRVEREQENYAAQQRIDQEWQAKQDAWEAENEQLKRQDDE